MARMLATKNRPQAIVALAGCAFLLIAVALLVYGRFAPTIGSAGLFNRASQGGAFISFGLSMIAFTILLYLQSIRRANVDPAQLKREIAGVVCGFFGYAVPIVCCLGSLSAADSIGAFALIPLALFAAVPFLYRRYRKSHPIAYRHLSAAALVLLCAGLAALSLVGGTFSCGETVRDAQAGWREGTFAVYDVSIDRPSGRGSWLESATYEVDLFTSVEHSDANEVDAHISVAEADWPSVQEFFDACRGYAVIRWYPQTQTLVGMKDAASELRMGDYVD